ncbi:MAG: citrate synthase [Planctomycetes bacterium]|nr:citrate synthase [Planctomycetota bacterium]
MGEIAKLHFRGKVYDLPVYTGIENESAVDISRLRSDAGLITLDPGYANTGSCKSSVCFIDGEKGILRYRGYDIAELAEKSNFIEVAWLLLKGELPTREERESWSWQIQHHTMIHEDIKRVYQGLPKDAHPMAVCSSVVGALSSFYQDALEPRDEDLVWLSAKRLLAKFPTIAAYSYKFSIGQPFMYPMNNLAYAENFLQMMFGTPCEPYIVHPTAAKALDLLLLLHAEHEQNCSTSTVRLVGSSMSNLFSSISAGISALWGRLHGGANQAVIEMLEQIAAEDGSAKKFVERAKTKEVRLMGFGHRVYKNFDPRAKILKKACEDLIAARGMTSLGEEARLLEIALELEEIALRDDYFIGRKLYPNVDFYSGIIYKALGIPVNMFTVLFAMGRLPGWIAHWMEMHQDTDFKIGRPRQIYTGPSLRKYVPMEKR